MLGAYRRRLIQRKMGFAWALAASALLLPLACAIHSPQYLGDCGVQLALGASSAASLLLLASRRLLNPLQSFVLVTYVWFGLGPCVTFLWYQVFESKWRSLGGDLSMSTPSAALAAFGLPLYAVCARAASARLARSGHWSKGVPLGSQNVQSMVLAIGTAVWLASAAASRAFGFSGDTTGVYESVGALGGTRVYSWSIGLVMACEQVGPWVLSALMWYLAQPRSRRPGGTVPLALVAIAVMAVNAVVGGWKSPLIGLALLYATAVTCRRQRPPWMIGAVSVVLFLAFIVPFVTFARLEAEKVGADSRLRPAVFLDVAMRPGDWLGNADAMDVGVLFRGVSYVGSEAIRRSDLFSGPWGGHTVFHGLEVLIPRPLLPDKRDMNIGNYVAVNIGADLGLSESTNEINNLAIFIPCEIAICFGWIAAWASFGVIGIAWSGLSCAIVGPRNLANHPFVPILVTLPLAMEAPLGHFLAHLRGLGFGLLILLFVAWCCRTLSKRARGAADQSTHPGRGVRPVAVPRSHASPG